MADQPGGYDPGRPGRDPEIGRLQNRIDVDRPLHRAPHPDVVEWRRLGVHPEPDVVERRLFHQADADGWRRPIRWDRADADRGVIELARLERDLGRLLVLDREYPDFLELGGGALPVRVANEREPLFRLPVLDQVRTRGCRRPGREPPARLFDRLAAHDAARGRRQRAGPERRERFSEHDDARILVHDLDVVECCEVVAIFRRLRRVGDPLVAEPDVVRGQLPEAVRKHDLGAKREPDVGRINLLDHLGRAEAPAPLIARPIFDQSREKTAQDVALGLALPVRRVEHLQIGRRPHPQHARLCCGARRAQNRGRTQHTSALQPSPTREPLNRRRLQVADPPFRDGPSRRLTRSGTRAGRRWRRGGGRGGSCRGR